MIILDLRFGWRANEASIFSREPSLFFPRRKSKSVGLLDQSFPGGRGGMTPFPIVAEFSFFSMVTDEIGDQ